MIATTNAREILQLGLDWFVIDPMQNTYSIGFENGIYVLYLYTKN